MLHEQKSRAIPMSNTFNASSPDNPSPTSPGVPMPHLSSIRSPYQPTAAPYPSLGLLTTNTSHIIIIMTANRKPLGRKRFDT